MATKCPKTGNWCFDPECGKTTSICNNVHCFSESEDIGEKKEEAINEKEKAHFWFHLGAASGIVASIGGKKADFEKAWSETKLK